MGLREDKRERTRRALIEAAYRLFDARGYDETTVADVAAAAGVSTATCFNYFPAKEDLLFGDGPGLLDAGLAAISERADGERAGEVLARSIDRMHAAASAGTRDPAGPLEEIRLRLITTVPSVRASALNRLFEAQSLLAEALRRACPGELDARSAAALVGAVLGAGIAVAGAGFPDQVTNTMRATLAALDNAPF